MKKVIISLLVLLLLTGCQNGQPTDKTFTCEQFSIVLPDTFTVMETDSNYQAAYANDDVMVMVSKTSRQELAKKGYSANMDLETYAGLLVSSFNVSDYTAHKNYEYLYFTYTAYVLDDYFYYTVGVYQNSEAFWAVSFACVEDKMDEYKHLMIKWCATVSVDGKAE